jgi:hypothetical protein
VSRNVETGNVLILLFFHVLYLALLLIERRMRRKYVSGMQLQRQRMLSVT